MHSQHATGKVYSIGNREEKRKEIKFTQKKGRKRGQATYCNDYEDTFGEAEPEK
jgi:hypothetical protein